MIFDILITDAGETVDSAATSVDALETDVAAGATAADSLCGTLRASATVQAALRSVQTEVLKPTGVVAASGARRATAGTSEALIAYEDGDRQMARTAERATERLEQRVSGPAGIGRWL